MGGHTDLEDAALGQLCEQAIRNHDPCISCATHFLDLEVERESQSSPLEIERE